MSLKSIFLTLLVSVGVWYWLKARELKDLALRHAARHCKELDLSVLDQTVVLKKLRVARDKKGSLRVIREYSFDFSSTGEDRYKGTVYMVGATLQNIKLAPHRVD